jgi:hypothetical protein
MAEVTPRPAASPQPTTEALRHALARAVLEEVGPVSMRVGYIDHLLQPLLPHLRRQHRPRAQRGGRELQRTKDLNVVNVVPVGNPAHTGKRHVPETRASNQSQTGANACWLEHC